MGYADSDNMDEVYETSLDAIEPADLLNDYDITGMYSRCPSCGMEFDDAEHTNEVCKALKIESDKPRFYMMDLENYNEDFLKEIIKWQDKKIKLLETRPK